jgi:hypothetical protein
MSLVDVIGGTTDAEGDLPDVYVDLQIIVASF